jgi:hypothetical protein
MLRSRRLSPAPPGRRAAGCYIPIRPRTFCLPSAPRTAVKEHDLMKTPKLFVLIACLAATPIGCSSSEQPADEAAGSETPAMDTTGQTKAAAQNEGAGSSALTSLKVSLNSFIEDDPTLDLAKNAAENAAAIEARIKSEANACPQATFTRASGSATLDVDFGGGCTLGSTGVKVSGKVSATVTAGSGLVSVAFTFTSFGVDGYTLSGTATVSTTDLKTYKFGANVDVTSVGKVTFDGKAAVANTGGDASVAIAGTLDGTGTYQEASASSMGTDGWSCVAKGTTFTATGLHRVFSQCYADAGSVVAVKEYACTKTSKKGQPLNQTLKTTTTVTFTSSTPQTGEVQVSVSGAGADAAASSTVKLPSHGSCGGG